jgi:hypothetical protein
MTLRDAIEIFDSERSNSVDVAKKIRWLSQLEYKINSEITVPRGDVAFKGYDISTPLDTVLKAPDEFSEIYSTYLNMKLDYMNGEIGRYNNSAMLFNRMYKEMHDFINRQKKIPVNTDLKAWDYDV